MKTKRKQASKFPPPHIWAAPTPTCMVGGVLADRDGAEPFLLRAQICRSDLPTATTSSQTSSVLIGGGGLNRTGMVPTAGSRSPNRRCPSAGPALTCRGGRAHVPILHGAGEATFQLCSLTHPLESEHAGENFPSEPKGGVFMGMMKDCPCRKYNSFSYFSGGPVRRCPHGVLLQYKKKKKESCPEGK